MKGQCLLKIKGREIEEITVLIFIDDVSKENWNSEVNEKKIQQWLDSNNIGAYADNNFENMVEVRWKSDVPNDEILRVYDLALYSNLFKDVKIGVFPDGLTAHWYVMDRNEFHNVIKGS